MAVVTYTVPDSIVPHALRALRQRYPDLLNKPDADVGAIGSARLLREAIEIKVRNEVEVDLQAAMATERQARFQLIADALNTLAPTAPPPVFQARVGAAEQRNPEAERAARPENPPIELNPEQAPPVG